MPSPTTILSVFAHRPIDGLLENHAAYAARWGYAHEARDSLHVFGDRQAELYKYHAIYGALLALADGGLLLVLDEFSVVYGRQKLEDVAQGHDFVVVSQEPGASLPTSSGMILRNTAEVRERLRLLVFHLSVSVAGDPDTLGKSAGEHLGEAFAVHPLENRLANGFYSSIQAVWDGGGRVAIDQLPKVVPLVAHAAPRWERQHGVWLPTYGYDFRYVSVLLEQARAFEEERPLDLPAQWEQAAQEARGGELHLNPQATIAFVSFYDAKVAGYGRIHEDNLARYCERHGYGHHLYRELPAFVPAGVQANWAKMHLVREHLAQHEQLFWIDADILAINQRLGVEEVLGVRDFVIGMDHSAWPANSGLMGFRPGPRMRQFVDHVCAAIEAVPDKSNVYAGGGDQASVLAGMRRFGLENAEHVVDAISLAPAPIYATRDSRFVHFPSQINAYRAEAMRAWDRWSHEQ